MLEKAYMMYKTCSNTAIALTTIKKYTYVVFFPNLAKYAERELTNKMEGKEAEQETPDWRVKCVRGDADSPDSDRHRLRETKKDQIDRYINTMDTYS